MHYCSANYDEAVKLLATMQSRIHKYKLTLKSMNKLYEVSLVYYRDAVNDLNMNADSKNTIIESHKQCKISYMNFINEYRRYRDTYKSIASILHFN